MLAEPRTLGSFKARNLGGGGLEERRTFSVVA